MKFISDLKDWYPIFFETGLIIALLLVLSAFKWYPEQRDTFTVPDRDFDTVTAIDIPIIKAERIPPKPPKPSVMVEVPNNRPIEDPLGDIDINWEGEWGESMALPDRPPQNGSEDEDEEEIFLRVEQEPEIRGGLQSLYEHISYPRAAKLSGIEGIVEIQFVVDTDGSVKRAKVVRGIGGGCDREALEAVKKLRFIPGRQRGTAVRVRMTLPVHFRLK